MRQQTRKNRKRNLASRPTPRRNIRKVVFLSAAAAILVVTGFWFLKSRNSGVPAPTSSSAGIQTGFQQLKGRWHRSDADYVIDIKDVDGNGRMEASYFNPRSIRVARAEASRQGDSLKVAIELRDVGYPGSTYDLTYDGSSGVLRGKYYQAVLKENFDVVFVKGS